MKFYKLNNTWVSWDELHNGYGYTTEPSVAVTYKSAHNGSSWGEDAGSGYYVGDIDDMVHGSFWCDSDYGWFELDGLVWNPEIYPSNATPLMMQNGGITSPAVSLESDGVTYYLIKVIVADTGWITADEAAELGWEVYDEMQGTFIVFDTVENKIVSAFTNELTYGEIEGIVLQSPRLVYGVDISVPTIQFWFTDEGRNYDEDKELLSRSILRDENGNRIKSPNSTIYDDVPILAYMHINGDMLESADGTIEYYGSGSLRTLTSVNGSAVGESVWSVFAERIFTLSFANTQLPGITITMPTDKTGYKGTSITLPTMSGEYESGGKTWTPSAWDIGAFGSSYTLNADTVAHLLFEEAQEQEIDIDVNYGDPVTIPAGYSVQSVKSSTAYAFAENATGSSAGILYFTVPGKNYYFTETDKSLLGYKTSPCLQLYQYTSDTGGNWITSRSSQSPSLSIKPDQTRCILNGTRNDLAIMLYFYATGPSGVSSIATAINGRNYAMQMRRYDTNDAFVSYHFNVPMVIWRYIDGAFSWQGDATATKSLAYWYTKTASTNTFRIHCVKGTLPSLYKIGWFAANKSDVYLNTGSEYALYDENGARIPYDSTKSYTFLWCVRGETTEVSIPASGFRTLSITDQSGYLRFRSETGGYTVGNASRMYYAET